ncbi:hypothetical protein ACP4OV_029417 [Aristida adscensionis]
MAVALLLQLRRCATVPISLSHGSPAEPLRQELRRVPTNSTPATPSPAVDRSSAMACSSVGRRCLPSLCLSAAAPAVSEPTLGFVALNCLRLPHRPAMLFPRATKSGALHEQSSSSPSLSL